LIIFFAAFLVVFFFIVFFLATAWSFRKPLSNRHLVNH
jgi:cbb3-type cytochrome oxidase subunit 3